MARDEDDAIPGWAWAVGGLVLGYGLLKATTAKPVGPAGAYPPGPGYPPRPGPPLTFRQQQEMWRSQYERPPEQLGLTGTGGGVIPQVMNGIPLVPLPSESAARTRQVRGSGNHGGYAAPLGGSDSAPDWGSPNESFGGSESSAGLGGESF